MKTFGFVASFFIAIFKCCSGGPCEYGDCETLDNPVELAYRWPITHRCIEKPLGVDSTKRECLKFFTIQQYSEETKETEQRTEHCKKHHAMPAMPKTCQQVQFLVSIKKMSGHCNGHAQVYIGAFSDNNAKSYRWSDDMHFATSEWGEIWFPGEPNNQAGRENCVTNYLYQLNDLHCGDNQSGMTCEICIPVSELESKLNNTLDICVFESDNLKVEKAIDGRCGTGSLHFQRPDFKNVDFFKHDKVCDLLPCPSYRWGPNCMHQCFCKNFEACHQETGKCPSEECEEGFLGERCDVTRCPRYRWGPKCETVCLCRDGEVCHPTIGLCALGCMPGAVGPTCSAVLDACIEGKYGQACDKTCNCVGICTRQTGLCVSGCAKGWFGPACNITECPVGRWGEQCEKYCACLDEKACDMGTGRCGGDGGCAPGWSGEACDKDDEGLCENQGKCPGSDAYPTNCTGLRWGPDCAFDCKNLNCTKCSSVAEFKGTRCDQCKPYITFNAGLCDKRCQDVLRYNVSCELKCSEYCGGLGRCSEINGTCLEGCKPGKDYSDTKKCILSEKEDDTQPVWFGSALGAALVASCCGFCCFLLWRRRNKKEEEEEEMKELVAEELAASGLGTPVEDVIPPSSEPVPPRESIAPEPGRDMPPGEQIEDETGGTLDQSALTTDQPAGPTDQPAGPMEGPSKPVI